MSGKFDAVNSLSYGPTVRPELDFGMTVGKAIPIDPYVFAEVRFGRLPAERQKDLVDEWAWSHSRGKSRKSNFSELVANLEKAEKIEILQEEMVGEKTQYPNIIVRVKSNSGQGSYKVTITDPPKVGEKFSSAFKLTCECPRGTFNQSHYGGWQDTNAYCNHTARATVELAEERGLDTILDFKGASNEKLMARALAWRYIDHENIFDIDRKLLVPKIEGLYGTTLKIYAENPGIGFRREVMKHSLPEGPDAEEGRRKMAEGVLPVLEARGFKPLGNVIEGSILTGSKIPEQVVFDNIHLKTGLHARAVFDHAGRKRLKLLTTRFDTRRPAVLKALDDPTQKLAAYVLVDIEPAGGLNPRKFNDGMRQITNLLPRRSATA